MTSEDLTRATFGARVRWLVREAIIGLSVLGDDLEQEIRLATQHVALAYLRPGGDQVFEGFQVVFGLAGQTDLGKNHDAETERYRVDIGMIAGDNAGFLERPDPAQAWRREIDARRASSTLVMRPSSCKFRRMRRSIRSSLTRSMGSIW